MSPSTPCHHFALDPNLVASVWVSPASTSSLSTAYIRLAFDASRVVDAAVCIRRILSPPYRAAALFVITSPRAE